MVGKAVGGLPVLAVLLAGGLLAERVGRAQELPAAPVPVTGSPDTPPVALSKPIPCPPTPDSAPPALYQDSNGPLLRGDPLLDRPEFAPPGPFMDVEVGILKPHVKNALVDPVAVAGRDDMVSVPMTDLDWVGSPRVELGYAFPEGFGAALLSYRTLATDGSSTVAGFDPLGNGSLKSRLDVNVIDIDYGSREYWLGPDWDMMWKFGVRVAGVYFDSRARGRILDENTSNDFWGAGPHLGLDLARRLGSGLSLFGGVEAATMLGKIHQTFGEGIFDPASGVLLTSGATNAEMTQAVPMTRAQFGLAWTPCWAVHWLRFTGGYEFEHWWYLGEVGASHAELGTQGVFLRGEWSF